MTPDRLEALREAHKSGMSVHGYHALADELFAEIDLLTQHSTWLNTITFKMAEALGEAPPGTDQIEANPVELADRLIVRAIDWTALDVAEAALKRIHDRADMPSSVRTITEHALRAERWDDTIEPGGWVCAICGLPAESEPCPEHGHTGDPWCCDKCAADTDRTTT